jgi:ATP-dependent phosphofructokinase / diphosphate-dependent phosphofructokinase
MAKNGGRLLVGQSGGPTAVINSTLCGIIQEAMRHTEITGVLGMVHGIQGLLREEIIDLGKESPETIAALKRTPAAALGSCRYRLTVPDYERVLQILKALDVRYFLYIGGNDSADTSHRLGRLAVERGYDLKVIGVPKTVDNDLARNDHCPGYGSVARFMALATMGADRDAEAMANVDHVKIIEAMGRNAGWITAASSLGRTEERDGPHLVYLPERALEERHFLDDVQQAYDRFGYCLVVVSEGVRSPEGGPLVASSAALDVDAFGHKQLGGVADYLCNLVTSKLRLKSRFDRPGTIQRSFSACTSTTDLEESYIVGATAVRRALEGHTDRMVTLEREAGPEYRFHTGLVDLAEVSSLERLMPDEYINDEGNNVTEAFYRYAMPLIGEPLPRYARLAGHGL